MDRGPHLVGMHRERGDWAVGLRQPTWLSLGSHQQSTSPLQADTNSDRLFTVNDVKVGGSKYGIISLHGLKTPTFRVHMHENLYFTNRKVCCPAL